MENTHITHLHRQICCLLFSRRYSNICFTWCRANQPAREYKFGMQVISCIQRLKAALFEEQIKIVVVTKKFCLIYFYIFLSQLSTYITVELLTTLTSGDNYGLIFDQRKIRDSPVIVDICRRSRGNVTHILKMCH